MLVNSLLYRDHVGIYVHFMQEYIYVKRTIQRRTNKNPQEFVFLCIDSKLMSIPKRRLCLNFHGPEQIVNCLGQDFILVRLFTCPCVIHSITIHNYLTIFASAYIYETPIIQTNRHDFLSQVQEHRITICNYVYIFIRYISYNKKVEIRNCQYSTG